MGRFIRILLLLMMAGFARGQSLPSSAGNVNYPPDQLDELTLRSIDRFDRDSALRYAQLALDLAQASGDKHQLAMAWLRKCQLAVRLDDDARAGSQYGLESLHFFEQAGSHRAGIDLLYQLLFQVSITRGQLEEARNYSEKYYESASQKNDENEIFESLAQNFAINRQAGNYAKSFEYAQHLYDIAQKSNNRIWISHSLWCLGQLYKLIGDYPNALTYYRKVYDMSEETQRQERMRNGTDIWFTMEFAELFSRSLQADSAWHYYELFKPSNKAYAGIYLVSTGEYYYSQGNFRQALDNFQKGLEDHERNDRITEEIRTLLDMSNTYLALSDFKQTLAYAWKSLALAGELRERQFIRDAYELLSTVYERMGKTDSADFYFRKFSFEREAMLSDQVRGNFKAYTYDQQIIHLNKEKQLQDVKLQKESLARNILIGSILALLVLALVIFRNISLQRRYEARRRELAENALHIQELESEKTRVELLHRQTELEMQALRAQMNPHFIFNCLNSINRFIIRNEAARASDYLTKFARLIRKVLEDSGKPYVLLEEELTSLQLYMDLEAIRFETPFAYEISCPDEIRSTVMIPSLLIQPFVENAIWHGLHPGMEGQGRIRIALSLDKGILLGEITDNGVGRRGAAEKREYDPNGRKSLGIQLTRNRLELADPQHREGLGYEVEDLRDEAGRNAGTRILIRIPVKFD